MIISIFLFSNVSNAQKENNSTGKDSIKYKLTNLTEAAMAIQANPDEIHLADYTGFESDNQYEEDLVSIATEIRDSLGFDVYDLGLWTIMSYTEGGIEQNIQKIESEISSNKYVLYYYNVLADKKIADITFIVFDKLNGVNADLSYVANIINTRLESFVSDEFLLLKRILIEIQTLEYFIDYQKLDNKFIPVESENNAGIYRDSEKSDNFIKSEMPDNCNNLLSISGMVFNASGATNLRYANTLKRSGAPQEYAFNSKGMVVSFTKDGHDYVAMGVANDYVTFAGYAYYDRKRKRRIYYEANPIIGDSVLVWMGLKVSKCPKNTDACNYKGFLVKMTSDISIPEGEINYHLKGIHSTFDEIKPKINKLGYYFLATAEGNEYKSINWLNAPTNTWYEWYETNHPCIPIPNSYNQYFEKTTVKKDDKIYYLKSQVAYINVGGTVYEMILSRGKDGIWYAETTDINGNYFYYYNYYCHEWYPLNLDEITIGEFLGDKIEGAYAMIFNIIDIDPKSPHFYLESGAIVISLLIPEVSGAVKAALTTADLIIATVDGILYWQEGKKTEAVLAFIGAEIAGKVVYKIIKKGGKLVIKAVWNGVTKTVENVKFFGVDKISSKFITRGINDIFESVSPQVKEMFLSDLQKALNGKYAEIGSSPFIRLFLNKKNQRIYELLVRKGRKESLRMNYDAVTSLRKLLENKKLKNFLSGKSVEEIEDLFSRVNGWGNGEELAYSFADIQYYFNKAVNNLSGNGTTVDDFEKLVNKFLSNKAGANNQRKGAFWILEDLANDVETYAGQHIELEHGVINARGNLSKLDIFCPACSEDGLKLLVEYKSGPNSIKSEIIKSQFIERDLFNADKINQIQWRIKDTGFTPELLKKWMKEHKSSINNYLSDAQKSKFFPNYNVDTGIVSDDDIIDFVNDNYDKIFKSSE